jgi:hypothetical protein
VDAAAAAIILSSFLALRRNQAMHQAETDR